MHQRIGRLPELTFNYVHLLSSLIVNAHYVFLPVHQVTIVNVPVRKSY